MVGLLFHLVFKKEKMNKYSINKKIIKKRNIDKIRKIIYFRIIPFFLFIIAFIFLLNQKSFSVKNIEIIGNEYLDNNKINSIIDSNLSGKNKFFISNKNFIFYPESEIEKSLKKEFIEIDNIDISYKSFYNYNNIIIKIKQKNKKYIWCDNDDQKCNFVSARGVIIDEFEKENGKDKKDYIIFYGVFEIDNNGSKNKKLYAIGSDFSDLEKYIESFNDIGFKVEKVRKIELGDYIFENKDNIKIIIPKVFSEDIIRNFKDISGFKDIKFDFESGEFGNNISYINLLFDKSIVYCLKDDECSGNY